MGSGEYFLLNLETGDVVIKHFRDLVSRLNQFVCMHVLCLSQCCMHTHIHTLRAVVWVSTRLNLEIGSVMLARAQGCSVPLLFVIEAPTPPAPLPPWHQPQAVCQLRERVCMCLCGCETNAGCTLDFLDKSVKSRHVAERSCQEVKYYNQSQVSLDSLLFS